MAFVWRLHECEHALILVTTRRLRRVGLGVPAGVLWRTSGNGSCCQGRRQMHWMLILAPGTRRGPERVRSGSLPLGRRRASVRLWWHLTALRLCTRACGECCRRLLCGLLRRLCLTRGCLEVVVRLTRRSDNRSGGRSA